MPLTAQRLKYLRSLARKKCREEERVFLAEGLRLVRDAVTAGAPVVELFHTTRFAAREEGRALIVSCRGRTTVTEVRQRDLDAFTDAVTSQGVAALVRSVERTGAGLLAGAETPSVLVALDGVSDPGNLGTLIRTCDWFGADGLLVGNGSVEIHNPKVVRATMGGIFRLPIAADVDLPGIILRARESGYQIWATGSDAGTGPEEIPISPRILLILGSEAHGISNSVRALADHQATIPRYGGAESLNVGVACGVLLASIMRRR